MPMRLRALLAPMHEYASRFEQAVVDGRGQVLQTASGTMRLQRPGQFRWEVVEPYSQLVVTDGTTVYVFDADLAQVTVQPLDETLQGTPARLLIGSMDVLESMFTVVREEDNVFYPASPRRGSALSPDSPHVRVATIRREAVKLHNPGRSSSAS